MNAPTPRSDGADPIRAGVRTLEELAARGFSVTLRAVGSRRLVIRPACRVDEASRALLLRDRALIVTALEERALMEALGRACTGLPLDARALRRAMAPADLEDARSGEMPAEALRALACMVARRQARANAYGGPGLEPAATIPPTEKPTETRPRQPLTRIPERESCY